MGLGTFSLKKTTTTLGGIAIKSYAKGDSIKIEQQGDSFVDEVGADGHTDRVANSSTSLMITLQITQTSPINDLLSGLLIADKASLKGTLPFAFKDLNGSTTVIAKNAWINKPTDLTLGEGVKVKQWVIKTGGTYEMFIGGNN